MSFLLTNSVKIICEGITYDSLTDLDLAIENTDYLGSPVNDDINTIYIAGRSGALDLTDSVYGGQYYQYRPINIKFGGIGKAEDWDQRISDIRNLFEGKRVKLIFKTIPNWYWEGRAQINSFDRVRGLARFELAIPYADPYMHRDIEHNFIALSGGTELNCRNEGSARVTPTVFTDKNIQIIKDDIAYGFDAGTHINTAFKFNKGDNILTITGNNANVVISYTEGKL